MSDRMEYDENGSLDEVVVGRAHLEQLNEDNWFLELGRDDGTSLALWFWSDTKIDVSVEERDVPDLVKRIVFLREQLAIAEDELARREETRDE
jgi:hypothetical protein